MDDVGFWASPSHAQPAPGPIISLIGGGKNDHPLAARSDWGGFK